MSKLNQLIEIAASQVKYGNLSLELEVHNGEVKSMQGNEQIERHYKSSQSTEAIRDMMSLLNAELEGSKSGLITFTVDIKSSDIRKLYIHRQFKHPIDNT